MENQKNNTKLQDFLKNYGYLLAIGFAIIAILFLLGPVVSYEIREIVYDDIGGRVSKIDYLYSMHLWDYFTTKFHLNFTMYITLGLSLIGIGFSLGAKFFNRNLSVAATMSFALTICFLILSREFFGADENNVMAYAPIVPQEIPEGGWLDSSLHGVKFSWGSAFAILFTTLAFGASISYNLQSYEITVRDIAEEGILVAMAFGLNFIKIPIGATGGSINFQMFPLMVIALRRGPANGLFAGGIIFGLLTCLTDGYGFACYPFDYLIGFGSVAIMGFFSKYILGPENTNYSIKAIVFILLSGVLSTFMRLVGSTVSSIVVYGYDLKAALLYNIPYVLLSGAVAIVLIIALYKPLIVVNRMYPVKNKVVEE